MKEGKIVEICTSEGTFKIDTNGNVTINSPQGCIVENND